MRKTREILRLKWQQDRSHREIARALAVGVGTPRERLRVLMRPVYKAGEKCFVDYSGKKPLTVDPTTGERVEVELFGAVIGASNFTYAEVTATAHAVQTRCEIDGCGDRGCARVCDLVSATSTDTELSAHPAHSRHNLTSTTAAEDRVRAMPRRRSDRDFGQRG